MRMTGGTYWCVGPGLWCVLYLCRLFDVLMRFFVLQYVDLFMYVFNVIIWGWLELSIVDLYCFAKKPKHHPMAHESCPMSTFMFYWASCEHAADTTSFRKGWREAPSYNPSILHACPNVTLFSLSLLMNSRVMESMSPWEPHCLFSPYVANSWWLWAYTARLMYQPWSLIRCSRNIAAHLVLYDVVIDKLLGPCIGFLFCTFVAELLKNIEVSSYRGIVLWARHRMLDVCSSQLWVPCSCRRSLAASARPVVVCVRLVPTRSNAESNFPGI